MRRLLDLYCPTCKDIEVNIFVREDSDKFCKCGTLRTVYWGVQGQRSTHADAFTPLTFGGVRYDSRESWESCRKNWKAQHGEDLEVVGDSQRQRRQQVEEAHHRAIQQAQRRGNYHQVDDLNRTHYKDRR